MSNFRTKRRRLLQTCFSSEAGGGGGVPQLLGANQMQTKHCVHTQHSLPVAYESLDLLRIRRVRTSVRLGIFAR